jgi:hypothetical protein
MDYSNINRSDLNKYAQLSKLYKEVCDLYTSDPIGYSFLAKEVRAIKKELNKLEKKLI